MIDKKPLAQLRAILRDIDKKVPESIQNALALAFMFAILGFAITASMAVFSPTDRYVEVENVSVDDAGVNQTEHTMSVRYDAAKSYPANIEAHLVYVSPNGTVKRVSTWRFETLIEQGTHVGNISFDIPEGAKEGQYYYELNVDFPVQYGIMRHLQIQSPTFYYGNKSEVEDKYSEVDSSDFDVRQTGYEPSDTLLSWQSQDSLEPPFFSRYSAWPNRYPNRVTPIAYDGVD